MFSTVSFNIAPINRRFYLFMRVLLYRIIPMWALSISHKFQGCMNKLQISLLKKKHNTRFISVMRVMSAQIFIALTCRSKGLGFKFQDKMQSFFSRSNL
jgi:hypothetical protein